MSQNLQTELLRAFVAVVMERSFTKASEKLYRSQAAVSMQIKRLEEQVDGELFSRERSGIKLTEHGEFVFEYAKRILELNDELREKLKIGSHQKTIRLGCPDDYVTPFAISPLRRFRKTFPNIPVELICKNGLDLLQDLARDYIDIAIVAQHQVEETGSVFRREMLRWVASPHFNLRSGAPLPLIVFPRGCLCREIAISALDAAGLSWVIALSSNSNATLMAGVAAGLGVTVMEETMIPSALQVITANILLPSLDVIHIAAHSLRSAGREVNYLRQCIIDSAIETRDASGPDERVNRLAKLPGQATSLRPSSEAEHARRLTDVPPLRLTRAY